MKLDKISTRTQKDFETFADTFEVTFRYLKEPSFKGGHGWANKGQSNQKKYFSNGTKVLPGHQSGGGGKILDFFLEHPVIDCTCVSWSRWSKSSSWISASALTPPPTNIKQRTISKSWKKSKCNKRADIRVKTLKLHIINCFGEHWNLFGGGPSSIDFN